MNYEFPQDGANRNDVRTVEFRSGDTTCKVPTASFRDLEGRSFSAIRNTTGDLDDADYPYDSRERGGEDAIARLDFIHHELRTGSCGPETLPEYIVGAQGGRV